MRVSFSVAGLVLGFFFTVLYSFLWEPPAGQPWVQLSWPEGRRVCHAARQPSLSCTQLPSETVGTQAVATEQTKRDLIPSLGSSLSNKDLTVFCLALAQQGACRTASLD